MKRLICSLSCTLLCLAGFAQKVYFVYIESESQQPFYLKIGEKTYNSSNTGYLILSKLKDSTYIFSIGFPQDKWPAQQFSVAVRSKDHGFLLKNFGEKGWGFFNLQTLSVQMADDAPKDKTGKTGQQNVSLFTEILAKAANDPSLKEKPVAVAKADEKPPVVQPAVVKEDVNPSKEEPVAKSSVNTQSVSDSSSIVKTETVTKKDTVVSNQQVQKPIDTLVAFKTSVKKEADSLKTEKQLEKIDTLVFAKIDSVKKTEQPIAPSKDVYKKSVVTKKSESSTTEGFGLVFIDQLPNGEKDTIRVLIANPQTPLIASKPEDSKKFLNISRAAKDSSVAVNSIATKCISLATQDEFLKLRKKMASQKSDEAMINESKKTFKAKCFTTEQVKNLGNLFLNEATKFQFYEVAYPFSFDRNNFASLQDEFKDAYFIHRFKKMLN